MRSGAITAWQDTVNGIFKKWGVNLVLVEDGTFGAVTRDAGLHVAHARGLDVGVIRRNGLTGMDRILIRGAGESGDQRSAAQKAAGVKRTTVDRYVARLRKRYAIGTAPRIITAAQAGLHPRGVFGSIGKVHRGTTHYAASPRAKTSTQGIILARSFDRLHASKGWGGLSYYLLICDDGTIIFGRAMSLKGAHVAAQNSGNIGVNFFSTTGDRPTRQQIASYNWWLDNGHTAKVPAVHRTPRKPRDLEIRGHKFWPGQSTGCPGHFTPNDLRG